MPRENAYQYKSHAASVKYIMDKLSQIDDGDYVDLDFISSDDVAAFCKLVGFKDSWAGKTIEQICEKSAFGPLVAPENEARIVLDTLKKMISAGQFTSREKGEPFDRTILNDFLPESKKGFADKPTLGHFWEWRYALQVELEHGRTRGTNVTNNHPILTGLVVMAHLAEDKLYYARLWVMESEGEICAAVLEKKKDKEIADAAKENQRAKAYLGKRLAEKAKLDEFELPK